MMRVQLSSAFNISPNRNQFAVKQDEKPQHNVQTERIPYYPSAQALRAAILPKFGGDKTTESPEAALHNELAQLQVPQVSEFLKKAQAIAKRLGHAETTPLHFLAAQFEEMSHQAAGQHSASLEDSIAEQMDNGMSVWNATVKSFMGMNSVDEILFHLENSKEKIDEALAAQPKALTSPPNKPPLSAPLLEALQSEVMGIKSTALTEELVQTTASDIIEEKLQKDSPNTVETRNQLEQNVEVYAGRLKSSTKLLKPFEQLMAEVPEIRFPMTQMLILLSKYQNMGLDGTPVKMSVNGEETEISKDEVHAMLQETEKQVLTAGKKAGDKIASVLGNSPIKTLQKKIPPQVLELWAIKSQLDAQLIQVNASIQEYVDEQAKSIRGEIHSTSYVNLMTAPYDRSLSPKLLKDSATAKAQALYTSFYDLLSAGASVQTESTASYLKTAKRNGAGDEEIKTLTRVLAIVKQLSSSIMGGHKGKSDDDDDEDSANGGSVGVKIKILKQAISFVKAYSNVDWEAVRNKTVDLKRAKSILDADDLIPSPIKRDLINFLKTGNRNHWKGQPLLILAGGGATDMVKREVVQVLNKVLDMPVYLPVGDISSSLIIGSGGRAVRVDPTLSPAAKAIIANKTPNSIVYIDNILRFTLAGGQSMFDDFASEHGRENFKEPDLDIPLNLKPFVFVASLEDRYTNEYLSALHGDRFNDQDMTLIDLGVDIDTFTKEKIAAKTAREIELKHNVRFGPGVVQAVCRDYAIYGRHDTVETTLRTAAKEASGSTVDNNGPVAINLEDLETKWLGPKVTRATNNRLTEPTVGSVNGLAAGGAGVGFVLRIGATKAAEWLYDPSKDKQGRYHIIASLGPVTEMTSDSAKKAFEAYLTDLLNNTVINYQSQYKLLHGLRHKAMTFQIVFPEDVDGPSAGAAMATTAISAATNIPIRHDLAMTGTIQDKGTIGPIGGIFGKVKSAYEAGITTMLMPVMNHIELQKDHPKFFQRLQEEGIKLIPVKTMDDVLKLALVDYNALLKEPTPEQLKLDNYDPLGLEAKEKQEGDERLAKILQAAFTVAQASHGQDIEAILRRVLGKAD